MITIKSAIVSIHEEPKSNKKFSVHTCVTICTLCHVPINIPTLGQRIFIKEEGGHLFNIVSPL